MGELTTQKGAESAWEYEMYCKSFQMATNADSPRQPRQMWELDPEVEKRLADRSIWLRGIGLGSSKEEVLPLLERSGSIAQRVRIYKMGSKDGLGEFAVYATYDSEESAHLNMTRLRSSSYRNHRLSVKKADPEGAYRPLTQQMKDRIRLKNLTKDDRLKLIRKKQSLIKLDKIRKINGTLREGTGSPGKEGKLNGKLREGNGSPGTLPARGIESKLDGKPREGNGSPGTLSARGTESKSNDKLREGKGSPGTLSARVNEGKLNGNPRAWNGSPSNEGGSPTAVEAPRPKEDSERKRKAYDHPSTSRREEVDKKRIRKEERGNASVPAEIKERKEKRARRGPHTPSPPRIIDRWPGDERNPFLPDTDYPWPTPSHKSRHRGSHRHGKGRGDESR